MLNEENTKKCRQILNRYGYRPQENMILEETTELITACSKLQKATCKMLRKGTTATPFSDNFKEELVDVLVMITQGFLMAGMSAAEINNRAAEKLDKVLRTRPVNLKHHATGFHKSLPLPVSPSFIYLLSADKKRATQVTR